MDPLDAAVSQGAREKGGGVSGQTKNELADQLKVRRDEIDVSLDNLTRLNLMIHPHTQYHVSPFGREFLLAISD
jgi:predicted transcriptional regulator